jgi:6-phosphogluconate dehydrogenase (decarboxylating)
VVTTEDELKLGMSGLGRMGADILARAIHLKAGVDVLVEPVDDARIFAVRRPAGSSNIP